MNRLSTSDLERHLDRAYETQGGLLSLLNAHGIKPDSAKLCAAIDKYAALKQSAIELTEWLRAKTGDNADWPVAITADNTEDAEKLGKLLTELGKACHE